uniref:DUF4203 domain-containing protein n=2 Tax=Kalmanozyma brasiliensis (strain GHG001) TaxID=1365824 RepID=V5GW27_KALBG
MAPRPLTQLTGPVLGTRDDDPDNTFQGHDPEAIAMALAAHSHNMTVLANDASLSGSYQGHDSWDIATAIQSYIVNHQANPWPEDFIHPPPQTGRPSAERIASIHAATLVSSSSNGNITLAPVFSLSDLVHEQHWMSVLLCIVWIIAGLFLLFFGWASFFWGSTLGMSRKRVDERAKKRSRFGPLFAGPPLAGGVGGIIIGFLFFSFLTTVVTAAICVGESKSVSSAAYFVIWLLPGLLGAFLAGHWPLFARAFTGLLAGSCLTLIITAMFGIQTLIIRAIVIAVCTSLITAPLLLPGRSVIHFHLLNMCTSIIGMVTFLDGVALVAPSHDSSASWIDLWVLLFALDRSSSEVSARRKWGTSVFKGYIAAAVLGPLVGFLFEFIFHTHAAEDPDMEWNKYLGAFTERLEHQTVAEMYDRAGAFEPAPTAWQKVSRAFGRSRGPAAYDNILAANDLEKSPFTNLPSPRSRRRARRARSTKPRGGPAKFAAAKRPPLDESDDDTTDYDSDASLHKLNSRSKTMSKDSLMTKVNAEEMEDELKPLNSSGDSKLTAVSAGQTRPPSYRTNSSKSGASS